MEPKEAAANVKTAVQALCQALNDAADAKVAITYNIGPDKEGRQFITAFEAVLKISLIDE